MRARVEGTSLNNNILKEKNKLGSITQTLTGTTVLDDDMPPLLCLDPGGAGREVDLPPEAKGLWFVIVNTADAAELLTVKEDSATTTIVTIGQNEAAIVFCGALGDGTLAWRAVAPAGVGDTLSIGTLAVTAQAQLGDASSDLVAFYGATVTTQPAGSGQAAVATSTITTASTTTTPAGYATTTQADNVAAQIVLIRTLANQMRSDLVTLGLIKGAA